MDVTRVRKATIVPIEDMKSGDIISNRQHLPEDLNFTAKDVYDLAYLGLTTYAISNKFRIDGKTLEKHFSKTLAEARSDKAAFILSTYDDYANDPNAKASKAHLVALKVMLDRVDSIKEPTIIINNNAAPIPIDIDMSQINTLLLEQ